VAKQLAIEPSFPRPLAPPFENQPFPTVFDVGIGAVAHFSRHIHKAQSQLLDGESEFFRKV
jgi:hypothetical protein